MAEIFIDFNNVLQKAEELEDISKRLSNQGESIIEEWSSINPWSGTAASAYKLRVIRLAMKVNAKAARLKLLAKLLRTAAETLKKAEQAAKLITG